MTQLLALKGRQVSWLEEKEVLLPAEHIALQWSAKKIETLDAEFKKQHFAVIELLDDEDALSEEKDTLDKQDDRVAEILDRIDQLKLYPRAISVPAPAVNPATNLAIQFSKRLKYIEEKLAAIQEEVSPLTSGPELDRCLV